VVCAVAGAEAVSRLRAGRVWRGLRASSAEFGEPPWEYAKLGINIAKTTDGGWAISGAADRPSQPHFVTDGWPSPDQLAFLAC
jgi:hypothetical protein